ncbi:unnamed protein product [Rangifer tarandus platyrhynchus]|uniref:Uncharacterized protein n=1 Tax=Rangifer tarandus platyrhynchus TaxID=3082113 RepID=A0ABN8XP36_RANTA|nr:unnamed protein product [Rangifer tarandus platyrhynchus]
MATHSPRPTILEVAVGSQVPQLSADFSLPGALCEPRPERASLLTEVQAYSKRPKTADGHETKFAGGTGGFSATGQRPGSTQTTDLGAQVCCSNALPGPSDSTSKAASENCSDGKGSSHSAQAQARTQCADTIRAALTVTAASSCHDAAHHGHSDLCAPGASTSTALRDFHMSLCAVHTSGNRILYACADASGSRVNGENCNASSVILGGAACRETPNRYITHVDRTETNTSGNGGDGTEINVPGNGEARDARRVAQAPSDANRACTSDTSRAAALSQVRASTPLVQKTTAESGHNVPTGEQHTSDSADPVQGRCGVRIGLPLDKACTTESWTTDSSALSCRESRGSSLLSALTGGTAPCGALPVFTVDGGCCGSGVAAQRTRPKVPLEHKLEQAVSGKEHGPVLDGRLYWGKKRGPYDRPVRTFLHDEERANTVLSAKGQAVPQRRMSAEQGAEDRSDAVTASVHMASVLGSSSSMASTRANHSYSTPIKR